MSSVQELRPLLVPALQCGDEHASHIFIFVPFRVHVCLRELRVTKSRDVCSRNIICTLCWEKITEQHAFGAQQRFQIQDLYVVAGRADGNDQARGAADEVQRLRSHTPCQHLSGVPSLEQSNPSDSFPVLRCPVSPHPLRLAGHRTVLQIYQSPTERLMRCSL